MPFSSQSSPLTRRETIKPKILSDHPINPETLNPFMTRNLQKKTETPPVLFYRITNALKPKSPSRMATKRAQQFTRKPVFGDGYTTEASDLFTDGRFAFA